jgi:hypothetical protein
VRPAELPVLLEIGPPAYCAQRPAHRPWRTHKKSPELWGPGLNVNVAASLLGQFGNDSVNLERVEERRIERDQSNATPIRFSLRQTARQGRLNCSALFFVRLEISLARWTTPTLAQS